ncbi:retrovirus-related pol polyprotein from transposon TNT 1-94 [Tanacetum coccineum]
MTNPVPAPPTDPPITRDRSSIWWIPLDEGFSSKNYVRKFLRDLHPKWREKVTSIEESKDLLSLALDELIGNLKVHEVVMEKDSEIYKVKKERVKSIGLKAKKESSDDETSTSGSDDEEYVMAVRDFKKFFRRKGKFVRQPREGKKSFRQKDEKKGKSNWKCFRCGDPNHLINDCPKPSRNKDQKAFIGGSWSDSENDAEDKTNNETCLMAQSSNEVCLRTCLEPNEWIKDSGCSKHMTGNKSLFSTYKAYDGGNVVFGSNLKGKIIEPKNVNEALKDESWVVAMQEELNQFVANDVWELVPLPVTQSVIGTKWVFRNKLDENVIVSRNKARLVAQRYNQKEGINYDETYASVARLESVRILLSIACANDFKLYQVDIKSAFLNGFINEEVYVAQPQEFIDFQKPNYVYKLKKALYGLKQAPKAWTLESRYVHEERTIDPSFYNDLNDDPVAKFTAIGLDELKKTLEQIEPYNSCLSALDDIRNLIHRRTVHQKIDKEGNTIHKLPNQIETNELFDHLRPCELVIRENVYSAIENRDHTQAVIALMLYCLENRQPFNLAYFIIRRMYFFRDRRDKVLPYGMILTRLFKNLKANMAQSSFDERYKLVPKKITSSSTESPPSDNGDLPSTKLSPRSYSRALKDDPNMSKEKKETRGMFENLGRALHNFARLLKKGCR